MSSVSRELIVVLAWWTFLVFSQRYLSRTGSRGLLHIVVGCSIIPLVLLVRHWYVAAIPTITVLCANAHANRTRLNSSKPLMFRLYASFAVLVPAFLLLYFWSRHRTDVVALSVLLMSFGDAGAAFVGKRFGSTKIAWTEKSWVGLLAFVFVSFLSLLLSVWFLFPGQLSVSKLLSASLICAVVEAMAPGAWDNPAVLSAALLLFGFVL